MLILTNKNSKNVQKNRTKIKIFPKILPPDYIENRSDNYLIIWRDLPYWMILDKEGFDLIQLSDGKHSLTDIVHLMNKLYPKNDFNEIEVNRFIAGFFDLSLKETNKNTRDEMNRGEINPKCDIILENITINITKKCNLRCKHCYNQEIEVKDSLSINDLKSFILEAMSEGFLSERANFAILGGEPLLQKNKVLEIAEFGKKLGFEVIVSTNGHFIDNDFAEKAKKANLIVQVSLEGSTSYINDYIRGKGSFIKTLNGIKCLVQNQVYVILSMVVNDNNFDDIEDYYNFGRSLGVNEIRYIPLKQMGNARNELNPIKRHELLLVLYDLIQKYDKKNKLLKRDYYSILKTTCSLSCKKYYCGTGSKTILIDADGKVYPCPNHCLPEFECGVISKDTFKEIWIESSVLKSIRETYNINTINPECAKCIVKYWCAGGCRGEAYENKKNLTSTAIGCVDIRNTIIESFWLLAK